VTQPKRRGGWPGPRKETAWTFKPDADATAAVTRYMDAHGIDPGQWGALTKALNAMLATHPAARTAKPTPADRAWTCHECDTRITDVQPETWLAVPCGHYVTHVQIVTMTYGPPSWPVALSMEPLTAKPDTEETQP
jgi:hypothetical protein